MAERGRVRDRGDIALIVPGDRFLVLGDEMGAGADAILAAKRLQSHKRRPRRIGERFAPSHEPADEILLGREHLAETEIVRRSLAVELRARRVPLLDAEHAERLGAVRRKPEWRPRLHDGADHGVAEPRRNADLVSKLAGKRQAVEPRWDAPRYAHLARGKIGKGGVGEVVGG